MTGAVHVRRVVVVHGPADHVLEHTLREAGLVPAVFTGDATIWLPEDLDGRTPAQPGLVGSTPEGTGRLLLTVVEAAEVLGVGRSTVYQLIQRGELDVVHVGRCARIPSEALRELVERLCSAKRSRPLGRIRPVGCTDVSQPGAASPA